MNIVELRINGTDKVVLIDARDMPLVKQYSWRYSPNSKSPEFGYVVTTAKKPNGKAGTFSLHRLLMGNPKQHVDHINGNRLDNRRSNLRLASQLQNTYNARKTERKTSSQYKGVYLDKQTSKWVARIRKDGTKVQLGSYDDEALAALAYDIELLKIAGEFARTNFPRSILNLVTPDAAGAHGKPKGVE